MKNQSNIPADNQSSIDLFPLLLIQPLNTQEATLNKSTKERLQRYSSLIIFTLVLLAASGIFVCVKYQYWPNYTVPILQGLLGSAAAGLLIDIAARHKFAKEIAREIFPHVVGQY